VRKAVGRGEELELLSRGPGVQNEGIVRAPFRSERQAQKITGRELADLGVLWS